MKKLLILDVNGTSATVVPGSNQINTSSRMVALANLLSAHNVETSIESAYKIQDIKEVHDKVDKADAVVIPGGIDVHPAFYGGEWKYPGGGYHAVKSDLHQMEATRHALLNSKKVFGICRGLQVINVALGGTLIQHFEGHRTASFSSDGSHYLPLEIKTTHPLFTNLGKVSCFHHQAIEILGEGLTPVAYSTDGNIIEGIEHESGNLIATQFHPESLQTFNEQMPRYVDWLLKD